LNVSRGFQIFSFILTSHTSHKSKAAYNCCDRDIEKTSVVLAEESAYVERQKQLKRQEKGKEKEEDEEDEETDDAYDETDDSDLDDLEGDEFDDYDVFDELSSEDKPKVRTLNHH